MVRKKKVMTLHSSPFNAAFEGFVALPDFPKADNFIPRP